jgi:hypothetical protein
MFDDRGMNGIKLVFHEVESVDVAKLPAPPPPVKQKSVNL